PASNIQVQGRGRGRQSPGRWELEVRSWRTSDGSAAVQMKILIEPVVDDQLVRAFRPAITMAGHVEVQVTEDAGAIVGAHARERHGVHADLLRRFQPA